VTFLCYRCRLFGNRCRHELPNLSSCNTESTQRHPWSYITGRREQSTSASVTGIARGVQHLSSSPCSFFLRRPPRPYTGTDQNRRNTSRHPYHPLHLHIKQLELGIEKCSTQLNAAMLRQQTLGIITSSSRSLVQADLEAQANVGIILALYKHESSQGCSVLTIIIPDSKAQVCASVVRTRYNDHLSKPEMVTVIESPSCAFDVKALGGLYKISRAAMERAVMMSKNQLGFDDWDDLDLP
jgi:hypothetical protein